MVLLPKNSMVNASGNLPVILSHLRIHQSQSHPEPTETAFGNREVIFPRLTSNFECNICEYCDNCLFVPPWEMTFATQADPNTVDVCDEVPAGYL